ncbi:hypothetical protein AB1Y20_022468 [Prymnesium parvum]|uniref:Glycosyl transferase CAP10 domain-containing protein n=1 Tax=Prymnesium parvum TaxID=97485 RepID=A0AB34JH88_PRYPA
MSTSAASCYVQRYSELLTLYCEGNISTCDWPAVRLHFDERGRAEGRQWGCSPSQAPTTSMPTRSLPPMSGECKGYHAQLAAAARADAREPHPLHHELYEPPPLAAADRCVATRLESRGEAGESAVSGVLEGKLSALVEHWTAPFHSGVTAAALAADEERDESEDRRRCTLIHVVDGEIFLSIAADAALLPTVTYGKCGRDTSENARLLTFLRMLRLALQACDTWAWRVCGSGADSWPDFALRLCTDDFCHGVAGKEQRPTAYFTMVSCETARSIPAVEWNPTGGRGIDLSVWDEALRRRRELRQIHSSHFGCRLPKAVWRGDAHNHVVYNMQWSSNRTLKRRRMSTSSWREQGRLALVYQKCRHPSMLDVRVKLLTLGGLHAPPVNHTQDPEYERCVRAVAVDRPKVLPLVEQAARFQMCIHVEGNGGWADRLRHLLLSGMVVLKQDMGVVEWWEPLLEPWVHFVPVSSTLHNLSDAVEWVRNHPTRALKMSKAAAALAEQLFSTRSMQFYTLRLLRRYASLYRGILPPMRPRTARFSCELARSSASTGRNARASNGSVAWLACRFSASNHNRSISRLSFKAVWDELDPYPAVSKRE